MEMYKIMGEHESRSHVICANGGFAKNVRGFARNGIAFWRIRGWAIPEIMYTSYTAVERRACCAHCNMR